MWSSRIRILSNKGAAINSRGHSFENEIRHPGIGEYGPIRFPPDIRQKRTATIELEIGSYRLKDP
jgi:hypothetical protein